LIDMNLALSSRPGPAYPLSSSAIYDVMSDRDSAGQITLVNDADSLFVPVSLPQVRRVARPPIGQMRNATFVLGLVSSMSVFEPAMTVAADPLSHWLVFSGLQSPPIIAGQNAVLSGGELSTLDSLFAPVSDSQHLAVLKDRIGRFVQLPAGWDGDGGVAPSTDAGDAARAFLTSLSVGALPHECHVVGDGEILFQWRSGESFIEAAFDGSTISWYAQIGTEEASYGDDTFDGIKSVDKRLLDAISLLS
jgi:hypothetical protein